MPIRRELRWFYPIDWPIISRRVRFERARGRCESCGRPHATLVPQLPDGRWLDEDAATWRDDTGAEAPWPVLGETMTICSKRVFLAAAHLDHDPSNSRPANLKALCQRCHLRHDKGEHLRRRRLRWLRSRALGDLFAGPYAS